MSKENFIENISDEKLVEIVDKALRYEKNKKSDKPERIKPHLFKIIPAVAAIALVIGLMNTIPIFMNNTGVESDSLGTAANKDYQTVIYYREFEKYEDRFNADSTFEWKSMEVLNGETVKSYYADQVIQDVIADLMKKYNYTAQQASDLIYSGDLKIYSCMDNYIQSCMEAVYADDKYFPQQSEGAIKHQSAMVILNPSNGDLLGIVGGRGNKVQRGELMNRASMVKRQPGSALSPISVYAPALDAGIINDETLLNDSPPLTYNGKPWPSNYPKGNEGMISLSLAVANSKNTTAVRVLQMLTPEKSFRFMYDNLNMKSLVEKTVLPNGNVLTDIDYAPLALGDLTYGVSVYELTGAYTMLANKGIYSKPRSYIKVTDNNGNIILDNSQLEQKTVISEETADIMTKLLRGVVENPRGTATGLPMKNKIQVAAATGITDEDYDRWFIGYTQYFLCGVWYGYDMPQSLGVSVGAKNPPMSLWNYVMDTIHEPVYDK